MKHRYRAAPSPTGKVHIGTVRAYLPNFLLARKYGGKNIIRIEDTDQKRTVENGVKAMIEAYEEVGIVFDEGPHIGGDYGPYIQTERKDIYRPYAEELVEEGKAYYCFCTPERLAESREEMRRAKKKPMYDRHCRDITLDEAKKRISNGEKPVIRMKIPEGVTICKDTLLGEIKFDNRELDDQVLLKSDGLPTYHLAVVIDDHLMEIDHVLRGNDWFPSFPKHVILYNYFGWDIPQFTHLPMILNPDGKKKLSKRHGAYPITQMLRKGYLKEGILNYAILSGWSPKESEAHRDEIYTIEDLIKLFSIDRFHPTPARYDQNKFDYINKEHIMRLDKYSFIARVLHWAERYVVGRFESDIFTEPAEWEPQLIEKTKKYLPLWKNNLPKFTLATQLEQTRIVTFSDLVEALDFYYDSSLSWEPKDWIIQNRSTTEIEKALKVFRSEVEAFLNKDFDDLRTAIYNYTINESTKVPDLAQYIKEETADLDPAINIEERKEELHSRWNSAVRSVAEKLGWKAGELFMSIRVATSGRQKSPPMLDYMLIAGSNKVVQNYEEAIKYLEDINK